MTDAERQLLQRLADAGKPTTLDPDELVLAQLLTSEGLLFLIKNTADAIITPKGRHLLASIEIDGKLARHPSVVGFRRCVIFTP